MHWIVNARKSRELLKQKGNPSAGINGHKFAQALLGGEQACWQQEGEDLSILQQEQRHQPGLPHCACRQH